MATVAHPLAPGYSPIDEDPSGPPKLLVVIDTEEEFDWNEPFDRANDSVAAMSDVGHLQGVFDEFGIVPTYVIDYPVASKPEGYRLLKEYAADGRATIGAHLHPWVTPPHEEKVCAYNSYPGNLTSALERQKLETMVATIEENFGERPTIYKAGRYGLGPNTAETLAELGFLIDLSLCPPFDYTEDGGPDYSRYDARPYRFWDGMLGLPTTGAFVGYLGGGSRGAYALAKKKSLEWARLPGILSRLGAVDRLFLSPEGYEHADHVRLTRFLLDRGLRTFTFSLHSPSARPGCTPYVKDERELHEFLGTCRRYFADILGELSGRATTPAEVRAQL